MKIGIITPNPPSSIGGVERFTQSLCDWLPSRGIQVKLFDRTLLEVSRWVGRSVGPWVRSRRVTHRPTDPQTHRPRSGSASKIDELRRLHRLGRLVRRAQRCDAYLANGMAALAAPRDTPTVMVFHGCYRGYFNSLRGSIPLWRLLANRTWFGFWEKQAARNSHVVAVSDSVAQILRTDYGLAQSSLGPSVIENGVDVDYFRPGAPIERAAARRRFGLPEKAFLGIYTGRLDPCKQSHLLLEMAQRLTADEGLLLALPSTQGRPKTAGAPVDPISNRRVRVFYDVLYEDMPSLLNAADCVLLPSTFEGCNYSIIEAMACGLPPIVSRAGHAPSIASFHPDLDRCVLDAPGCQDLLQAFRGLRHDWRWRSSASYQARRYACEHTSLTAMGEAYVALFEKVLHEQSELCVGRHSHEQSSRHPGESARELPRAA